MLMNMLFKWFGQNRSEIGLKVFGSVRSLVLGSGVTLAAFRAEGNIFC